LAKQVIPYAVAAFQREYEKIVKRQFKQTAALFLKATSGFGQLIAQFSCGERELFPKYSPRVRMAMP
jgi:hypothetical protein